MAVFNLDLAKAPERKSFRNVPANDWAQIVETITGLDAGDSIVQAAFTAKVTTADSDAAGTTVQRLVTTVASGTGSIVGNVLTFLLSPAETAKLVAANLFDIQIWVQRGAITYVRTVLVGSVVAVPDVTNTTTLALPGNSITIGGALPLTGAPGAEFQLSAVVKDVNNTVLAGANIAWASSNPLVASVDQTGYVRFWTNGTCTITASSATYAISSLTTATVTDPLYVSATAGMVPTLRNGVWTPENPNTRFTISDPLVSPHMTGAVVDSGGLTVTAGGISVTAGQTTVQGLTVNGTLSLNTNSTIQNGSGFIVVSSVGNLFFRAAAASSISIADNTTATVSIGAGGGRTTIASGLTVSSGGIAVTAGGLTVSAGGILVSSGDITLTTGALRLDAANAQLVMRRSSGNAQVPVVQMSGDVSIFQGGISSGQTIKFQNSGGGDLGGFEGSGNFGLGYSGSSLPLKFMVWSNNAAGATGTTALTGTLSSVGTAVTGTGTLFLTELRVGDVLFIPTLNNGRRVTAIASDTALTLEAALISDVTSVAARGQRLVLSLTGNGVMTVAGSITITGASSGFFSDTGAADNFGGVNVGANAGFYRMLKFNTAGSPRWALVANSSAESGANAGSAFSLFAYADNGTQIDTPITVQRPATGFITLARDVSVTKTLTVGTGMTVTAGGASITGNTTVTGTLVGTTGLNAGSAGGPAVTLTLNSAAGAQKDIQFLVGGARRWQFRSDSTAESGANAGSNFSLSAYDDTGTSLDTPITIARVAGGSITLSRPLVGTNASFTTGLLTGGTSAAGTAFTLASAAGQGRDIAFSSAGVNRWIIRVNGTAETGSNAGSDFQIIARDDAGAQIDSPISITRAAGGLITLSRPVSHTSTVGFNGTAPIAKPALPIAAVDAATTQTLANAIRTVLINYGLTS